MICKLHVCLIWQHASVIIFCATNYLHKWWITSTHGIWILCTAIIVYNISALNICKKCNFDYFDKWLKSTGLDLFSSNESACHLHIKNLTIVLFAGFYGRTSAHFIAITGNKYVITLSLHTFISRITIGKFWHFQPTMILSKYVCSSSTTTTTSLVCSPY